ncbi:unnamed protein product [Sphagnum jensenii]
MAQGNSIEQDLSKVAVDAATSKGGDHQATNRLQHDVADFMNQHRTLQDRLQLTTMLRNEGLPGEQIAKLEKMGFPSLSLSESNGSGQAKAMNSTERSAARQDGSQSEKAIHGVGAGTDTPGGYEDSHGVIHLDKTQQHLIDQLHAAELKNSGKDMEAAYKAIQQYRDANKDSAALYTLGSAIERQGLMPELAVCALQHEFPDLQKNGEISRAQVASEANKGDALHQMFADYINRDFASYNYHDTTRDVHHAGKGHVHNGHIDATHVRNLINGGWNKGGTGSSEPEYNPKDE